MISLFMVVAAMFFTVKAFEITMKKQLELEKLEMEHEMKLLEKTNSSEEEQLNKEISMIAENYNEKLCDILHPSRK